MLQQVQQPPKKLDMLDHAPSRPARCDMSDTGELMAASRILVESTSNALRAMHDLDDKSQGKLFTSIKSSLSEFSAALKKPNAAQCVQQLYESFPGLEDKVTPVAAQAKRSGTRFPMRAATADDICHKCLQKGHFAWQCGTPGK